jgi:hypothetical protein
MSGSNIPIGIIIGLIVWLILLLSTAIWVATNFEHGVNFIKSRMDGSYLTDFDMDFSLSAHSPSWSTLQPFWSPISIDLAKYHEPIVSMCQLNHHAYAREPHRYHSIHEASTCENNKTRIIFLHDAFLETKVEREREQESIPPSGFIFHEGTTTASFVAAALSEFIVCWKNICFIRTYVVLE